MTEEFITLFKRAEQKKLIPFLRSLTDEQKKELVPHLKKLAKEYLKFEETSKGTFGRRASLTQQNMLLVSSFVCMNLSDFEKTEFAIWILDKKILNTIFPWYCPSWFNDFVSKQSGLEFIGTYLDYDWIIELQEKEYITPSKELLVNVMPQMIFESNKDNSWAFKPENLLKRPITLQQHFWYLFEADSNIHYADRFLYFGKEISKEKIGWKLALIQYAGEGKIDRQRLLKESLLATNRNFHKVLSGWFAQLFTDLEPTGKELLALQKELFSVLSSPHSKAVNTSLQAVKKISAEKEWDIQGFLDAVPVLLTSDTKATVAATLMILEKLAKKSKTHGKNISRLACQVFIHPDDELQAKAAKLILDNRDLLDASFREELEPFHTSMLITARKLLEDYLSAPGIPTKQQIVSTETGDASVAGMTPIPVIENIDDLVFLASQAFDNNQPWHISVFPGALVQWQKEIRGDNFSKFEPALQRALKMINSNPTSQTGQLDHMLAVFFIDVCVCWVKTYPAETTVLIKLFEKFKQVKGNEVSRWTDIEDYTAYLMGWEGSNKGNLYFPYKQLLLTALEKIWNKDDLPLLSTATHEPGWIAPVNLAERFILYQKASRLPYDMDLQVAISRCRLQDTGDAITLAKKELKGERLNLLLFLLDKEQEPIPPFDHPSAWMMASLAKKEKKMYPAFESFSFYKKPFNNYTGQLKWQSVDEEYKFTRFDYESRKDIELTKRQKILRVFKDYVEKKENGFKKFVSKLAHTKEEELQPALCDCLILKTQYLNAEQNDIKRILLLAPNNPEPLLADTLNHCLKYPAFWEEPSKKFVIAVLQLLHEIWDDYGEMAHVFIGTCMISSDKTVTNIAGEIWINAVTNDKINNEKLGEVIGLHERIEFAPLKRFTNLVTQQLFRISEKHNQCLQLVVENILKQLPAEPITHLKKLLEIYAELLSVNNTSIADKAIIVKLEDWKRSGGLQKIAGALLVNGLT